MISLAAASRPMDLWWACILFGALLLAALPLGLVFAARAPDLLRRIGDRAATSPWGCATAGGALVLLVILAGAAVEGFPIMAVVFVLLLVLLASLAFAGFAAEAGRLGLALRSAGTDGNRIPLPSTTWTATLTLGWLILSALPLFPLAGSAVQFWFLLRGTGAAAAVLITREVK